MRRVVIAHARDLAIHMFFDCLALAMGLLASVMATWPRNETFTYGCALRYGL